MDIVGINWTQPPTVTNELNDESESMLNEFR